MNFPIKEIHIKGLSSDDELSIIGTSQINVFVGITNTGLFDFLNKIKTENNFTDVVICEYPENGLHYSEQNKFMQNICSVAVELDQQVFVKTHSSDIVSSFATLTAPHQEMGALFHMGVSIIDGKFLVSRYSGERAFELINMGRDLR